MYLSTDSKHLKDRESNSYNRTDSNYDTEIVVLNLYLKSQVEH